MKIKLVMDEEMAQQLTLMLETIARCGINQFDNLIRLKMPGIDYDTIKVKEGVIRHLLSTCEGQANPSITSSNVNDGFRMAWDAYQHLRRELAWYQKGKDWRINARDSTMTLVNYDAPFKTSNCNGRFETEIVKD
jgi:hypothetical protein